MTIHYLTPDPRMLLRSDGVLVASDPGIEAREPEEDELEPVLMAAAGFGIDALAELMTRRGTEDVLAARSQVTLTDKVKTIFEKIPEAGDFFEFGFAILSLVGFDQGDDPLLRQVQAVDNLLHDYFKRMDAAIYASWSATRLAMLADVQAHAAAAREIMRSIFQNHDDLASPLTVARLAQAERDSLVAVNTFTGNIDGGYWLRPYSAQAVSLEFWANKFEDRAPVNPDNTVWDPRIAIPTLLYAIASRMIVLKAMHGDPRRFCHEINQIVQFLLGVQVRWGEGLRRKLKLTPSEAQQWGGFTDVAFHAGAIDVFTGNFHMIFVDHTAHSLYYALGFTADPDPHHTLPYEYLHPSDVAPDITREEIDMRFYTGYREILAKQAAFSFTRLRWITGLQVYSETIKALGEVCNPPPRRKLVVTYRNAIKKTKNMTRMPGSNPDIDRRARFARSLADLMSDPTKKSSENAMANQFLLFNALDDSKGTLMTELTEVLRKHMAEKHSRPS